MVMETVFSVALLFVGIAVLVVIHMCIVRRAFRIEFEDGSMLQVQISSINGSKKTAEDVLEMLPAFDYKAGAADEKGNGPADCVVCLENFRNGDNCRLLPNCGHSFHSQCVDSWLLKTPICPICRTSADPSKAGMILGEERGASSDDGADQLV